MLLLGVQTQRSHTRVAEVLLAQMQLPPLKRQPSLSRCLYPPGWGSSICSQIVSARPSICTGWQINALVTARFPEALQKWSENTKFNTCFQETGVTLRSSAAQIPWVALTSSCTDESCFRAPPRRNQEVISLTTWQSEHCFSNYHRPPRITTHLSSTRILRKYWDRELFPLIICMYIYIHMGSFHVSGFQNANLRMSSANQCAKCWHHIRFNVYSELPVRAAKIRRPTGNDCIESFRIDTVCWILSDFAKWIRVCDRTFADHLTIFCIVLFHEIRSQNILCARRNVILLSYLRLGLLIDFFGTLALFNKRAEPPKNADISGNNCCKAVPLVF